MLHSSISCLFTPLKCFLSLHRPTFLTYILFLSGELLTFFARQVCWLQFPLSEEVFPLHSEGYRSQGFLINTSNILFHFVLAGMVSEGKLDIIFIVLLSR